MEPQAKDPQAVVTLEEDSFGRVERVTPDGPSGGPGDASRSFVRRVACGGRIPGSGFLARRLLARERRALVVLEGLERVPALLEGGSDQAPMQPRRELHRSWLEGVPIAVKDEVDMVPYPTTVGTSFLGTSPATEDATTVDRTSGV